ncbi:MAG: ribosome small subunit-dependent GTPase A [Ruminococcaceae bacterium]|nr:ribosome small subunit-dependent GTPase A [Oscillospiraceae bacterium]
MRAVLYEEQGRLVRGVGGLYEIRLDGGDTPLSGRTAFSRAKGNFRHAGLTPLVGDRVRVRYDDIAASRYTGQEPPANDDGGGVVIAEILPRLNALIRPPMANIGVLFIAFAAAQPAPALETVDKLIAIAEYNHIEPIPVISKKDIAPEYAAELCLLYRNAGFTAFTVSSVEDDGVGELRAWIDCELGERIAAFAGASGVGKSTLLNALYPKLSLATGEISRKIERGRHTTRRVELYPIGEGFVADTPGFSMLDFVRFDFFKKEDLPLVMREFDPYLGTCRYTKCTHTKEEGCAVLAALREGKIAPSRHASFLSMYEDLRHKHDWSKK